jgi:hypothetical protein
MCKELAMVVRACNTSTGEAEEDGGFKANLGYIARPC